MKSADYEVEVGIIGYGTYVPWQRIKTEEIVKERNSNRKDLPEMLKKVKDGLLLLNKSVACSTEDQISIGFEAAENAVRMAGINPKDIKTIIVGSESKPFAVGKSSRYIASFLGMGNDVFTSDIEGACNAGIEGIWLAQNSIKGGKSKYALAIGADVAQAPKGDPLEYAAGAGAGAFVLGTENLIAKIEDMKHYSSLKPDFWRRDSQTVPNHFGRTTTDTYIETVIGAMEELFKSHENLRLSDFDYLTFHQPSGYIPLKTCKTLIWEEIEKIKIKEDKERTDLLQLKISNRLEDIGLKGRLRLTYDDLEIKVKPNLRVSDTGNTYAGSTPISVASILDKAKPGQNILAVSYGSGAYSTAMWLKVRDGIKGKTGMVPTVDDYVNRRKDLKIEDYGEFLEGQIKAFVQGYKELKLAAKQFVKENILEDRLVFRKMIGRSEPLTDDSYEISLCPECERIYFPSRESCMEWSHNNKLVRKSIPKVARLVEFRKLSNEESLEQSMYDVYIRDWGILVDCNETDLKEGMKIESVPRRLDYEGKNGLIIYGPAYRPIFRYNYPAYMSTIQISDQKPLEHALKVAA